MVSVTDAEVRALPGPNQIYEEWRTYLQFVQAYCRRRGIAHPVVVEIGTQSGRQKAHYAKFLDAVHIGIDISDEYSKPDILGDSHAPETMAKLKEALAGRPINVLFIDAFHTYEDALAEYESYGPLATDIIAFHDIRHERGIERLWLELKARERGNRDMSFMTIGAWGNGWCELGIGLIVKCDKAMLREVISDYNAMRRR